MSSFSHRILTENVNLTGTLDIVDKYFDSYTWNLTNGRWKGKTEPSICIELVGAAFADVRRASEEIRIANNQEAVLIFSVNGKQTLVIA